MTDASSFTKLVPGFDFLQGLVKNAGAALPGIGQWVAPTIDPAELEKRISELRTVQYWLEQNARMLGATIQALEVQRMTLSTLKTMNVQMEGLRDSLKIRVPEPVAPAAPAAAPEPEPEPEPAAAPAAASAPEAPAPGVVDPMQWWGALTKQFTELATTALKDTDAARAMAGAMVQQSFDPAKKAPARKTAAPTAAAPKAPARKSITRKSINPKTTARAKASPRAR
jgi:hypothetical protein